MSNYGKIKTTAELEKAIKEIHARRRKAGKGLEKDVNRLKSHYKPANLMLGAVQRFTPYVGWSGISLGLIRGLKRLLRK